MATKNDLNVCLMGSPAAGKTCFLGGLAILTEPDRNSPFIMVSQGTCFQYLSEVAKTLKSGTWPAPTNVTQWIDAHFLFKGGDLHLTILDYPGGDYKDHLATIDPSARVELEQSYREADVFLMLLDPESDILVQAGMSPEAREQLNDRQTAHLQHAMDSFQNKEEDKGRKVSLGLIITKSDKYPELSSPESAKSFLEKHASNFLDKLDKIVNASGNIQVFPVTAIGKSADNPGSDLPSKVISPAGYEELFNWLHNRQWWKKWGKTVRNVGIFASIAATILLGYFTWIGVDEFRYKDEMTSNRKSAMDRLAIPFPQNPVFINPGKIRLEVAKEEHDRLQEKVPISSLAQLEELEGTVKKIMETKPPAMGDFEKLNENILKKQEEMLLKIIESAPEDSTEKFGLCQKYITKFANKAIEIQEIQNKIKFKSQNDDIKIIKEFECGNKTNMMTKASQIDTYIRKYKPKDADAMKLAIGLARQLAENRQYTITLRSIKGFKTNYDIYYQFNVGNKKEQIQKSLRSGTSFEWPDQSISTSWVAGERISLEVTNNRSFYNFYNDDVIAKFNFPDEFDCLLKLMDNEPLKPASSYPDEKDIRIEVEITTPDGNNITPERHKAFRDYIHPGKAWETMEVK